MSSLDMLEARATYALLYLASARVRVEAAVGRVRRLMALGAS